jgi:hypothetical protein
VRRKCYPDRTSARLQVDGWTEWILGTGDCLDGLRSRLKLLLLHASNVVADRVGPFFFFYSSDAEGGIIRLVHTHPL